jgi:hypothetical protein
MTMQLRGNADAPVFPSRTNKPLDVTECRIKELLLIEYGEAVSEYSRATFYLPSATEEEREAVSAAAESARVNAERIYAQLLAHREEHGC